MVGAPIITYMSEVKLPEHHQTNLSFTSEYDRVLRGIGSILSAEYAADGTVRSQCYDGEFPRRAGITNWVGFEEEAATRYLVQEEVLPDSPRHYLYIFHVGSWSTQRVWGVNLRMRIFGPLYPNRISRFQMAIPDQDDLDMLATALPEKFEEAQAAGRIEYPLRSVKTVQSPIPGAL